MRPQISLLPSCRILVLVFGLIAPLVAQVTPRTGNVGVGSGGPFDVLLVNGSAGGADRAVDVALNQSITIAMTTAPTSPPIANFAIFGMLGVPGAGDASALPLGIGTSAFPFYPLDPTNPLLFVLTDNFGIPGLPGILGSTPAPWSFANPAGLPFPYSVTIQGLIADTTGVFGLSITNMVTINVVNDATEVIYSKIGGHPTAIVPGAVDTAGTPVVTEFRAFEQLVGSPDGTNWALRGRTQQGTASETMMMMGQGNAGLVVAQKGRPVPGGTPTEIFDFFGSGLGRFNDQNDFAYSARAAGGPTGTLQKVLRIVGGTTSLIYKEGDLYTGLVDLPANPAGDEKIGNSVGSIHLLNNLTIGMQDSTITGISTTRRPAIFLNNAMFHQTNVTTVLDGVTPQTWATINSNEFFTTPDGSRWIAGGRIVAPSTSDAVLVVDGVIALREGSAITGTSDIVSSVLTTNLGGDGRWFARGALSPSGVYAVMSGVEVAKTGDPIIVGSPETWGTSFSAFVGNRNGDWVIFGKVSSGSTATDDIVVLNGTDIVLREGDPVDLNQNGFFDDNVFIGRGNDTLTAFSADNAFLTDGRVLYFFVSLRDGAGNDLQTTPVFSTPLAFLRKQIVAN